MDRPRDYAECGERLQRARIALGISAADMANALRVPLSTYSRWETGYTQIRASIMAKLYELHGISPTYLVTGNTAGMPDSIVSALERNDAA